MLIVRKPGTDLLLANARTGQTVAVLTADDDEFRSRSFSSSSRYVVGTTYSGELLVWDATTGAQSLRISLENLDIEAAAIDRDGRRILVGASDGSVRMIDAKTGGLLSPLGTHPAPITKVAFRAPDDEEVETGAVSASQDGTVTIWDLNGKPATASTLSVKASLGKLSDLVMGDRLLAASFEDKAFAAWTIHSPRENTGLLSVSANGDVAAFFRRRKGVTISNPATQQVMSTIEVKGRTERPLAALSPDGKILALAAGDRTLRLWDTASGRMLSPSDQLPDEITALALSADGKRLALGLQKGQVGVWAFPTLERQSWFPEDTGAIHSLAFDTAFGRLAVAKGQTVTVRDLATGKSIRRLDLVGGVQSIAFDHAGKRLAATTLSGVTQWDTKSWSEQPAIKVFLWAHERVAYVPDDRYLLTGGNIYDASGQALLTGSSDADRWRVSPFFNRDGTGNIAASIGRQVTVHPLFIDPSKMVAHAKRIVPRCLTPEQRRTFEFVETPPAWCAELRKWPSAGDAALEQSGSARVEAR